jgi:trimethylamine--corrinoid protein Co-methyltransferase
MDHLGGPVERAMINSAVSQMAQHFEVPLYSTGGTSDSKEVDIQAAYESAISSVLVAMSGANYIHDIAGLMEADLTVAYEKLVMDDEILGMCQRVLRGIEVNDDTLATETVMRKGPGKDYLGEDHTITHMRTEFYEPPIANRQKREMYKPENSALAKAKEFVKKIRNTEHKNLLGDELCGKILKKYPEIKKLSVGNAG